MHKLFERLVGKITIGLSRLAFRIFVYEKKKQAEEKAEPTPAHTAWWLRQPLIGCFLRGIVTGRMLGECSDIREELVEIAPTNSVAAEMLSAIDRLMVVLNGAPVEVDFSSLRAYRKMLRHMRKRITKTHTVTYSDLTELEGMIFNLKTSAPGVYVYAYA